MKLLLVVTPPSIYHSQKKSYAQEFKYMWGYKLPKIEKHDFIGVIFFGYMIVYFGKLMVVMVIPSLC